MSASRRHAELAVFDYIETFYNPTRRHSSLGYTGLDPYEESIAVTPGQSASLAIKLDAAIYRMETFQVTTEAEGNAAAITRQRNSLNLINAASTDAFGSIANQNPGEVFLPCWARNAGPQRAGEKRKKIGPSRAVGRVADAGTDRFAAAIS